MIPDIQRGPHISNPENQLTCLVTPTLGFWVFSGTANGSRQNSIDRRTYTQSFVNVDREHVSMDIGRLTFSATRTANPERPLEIITFE